MHELQVVHDHERNIVLGLQPPCLGPHGERRERSRIVNPDRRGAQEARRARELGIVVVAAPAQPLGVDQAFRAEQPLHELVLGHFQGEHRDRRVVLDGGVLDDVQRERRFAHGWARGEDDEIRPLEARGVAIEIDEAAGDSGQRTRPRLELLDALHRRPDELLDADELFGAAELRHLEDAVLGVVEHFPGGAVAFVDVLDDAGRRFDETAHHRLVAHDLGVIVDVCGRRHDVDQGGDVLHAAGPVEIAAALQLALQRDGIDHVAALGEREHRPIQQAMALLVEHRVVQDFGRLERRILVQHHRAQNRLLRFVAPRSLAAGVLTRPLSRRGGERRYGRHPRLVSSSWGSAAARPDGRSRPRECHGTGEPDCVRTQGTVWC